jgi:hypothetical protein
MVSNLSLAAFKIHAQLFNLASIISVILWVEETGQKYLQVEQTYFGYNFPTAENIRLFTA